MARRRSLSDPLTLAALPPSDESSQEKERRLRQEIEAKRVSDAIDEQIKQEKAAAKKRKEVKILLLGQSESGKSTTLKQFQLMYAPNAFNAERVAWRGVIYLNLVRSIRRIIEALSVDYDPPEPPETPVPESPTASFASATTSLDRPHSVLSVRTRERLPQFEEVKERLQPLLELESKLIRMLSSGGDDDGSEQTKTTKEVYVRSNVSWKKALTKLRAGGKGGNEREVQMRDDPDDPAVVMSKSKLDMITLWRDPFVREVLEKRKMRLEESSGFFLDEIDRIAARHYIPSEDDVLKARLKTLGVVEHTFTLDTGVTKGVDWKIYDVGGSRNQRHAWAPYFEDVNAIIFLAPISAFDQNLSEDPNINRVEDSLLLWRAVCGNKLLAQTSVVLFLNKCDLLRIKIDGGVKLVTYMTSYGDRPNDYESVSKYFRNKFLALHKSYTPNQNRELYVHLTSVIDRQETSAIILNVRDILLRTNLKRSQLV